MNLTNVCLGMYAQNAGTIEKSIMNIWVLPLRKLNIGAKSARNTIQFKKLKQFRKRW